jgi:hypothetical protein
LHQPRSVGIRPDTLPDPDHRRIQRQIRIAPPGLGDKPRRTLTKRTTHNSQASRVDQPCPQAGLFAFAGQKSDGTIPPNSLSGDLGQK